MALGPAISPFINGTSEANTTAIPTPTASEENKPPENYGNFIKYIIQIKAYYVIKFEQLISNKDLFIDNNIDHFAIEVCVYILYQTKLID